MGTNNVSQTQGGQNGMGTFVSSKSVRPPQARRLEPAPQAHLEPQGNTDHRIRTKFSRRDSITGTRFNRSISIL